MARICEVCKKKPLTGNKISHSHRKTKRRWLPNLQKVTLKIEGKNKTLKICTRCLKTLSKTKSN